MRRPFYLLCLLVAVFLVYDLALGLHAPNWDYVDESTYIPAAAALLAGHSCPNVSITSPTGPTLCNYEHPPLVKALMALSLYAFGHLVPNVPFGSADYQQIYANFSTSPFWFLAFRFFQLLMGALSLPLLYVIAHKITGSQRLGLLASGLLLAEPVYAFFSRTAYLDIPMVFFGLCAYAVYFGRLRLGPVNQYWLAGILLALSVLSKEAGAVFLVPVAVYHSIFAEGGGRRRAGEVLRMVAGEVVTGAAGLQLYDTLARTPFTIFTEQVQYMFLFARILVCNLSCSVGSGPAAWFLPFITPSWVDGLAWNYALTCLAFVWVPVGLYSLARRKDGVGPEEKLFVFALLLFASTLTEDVVFYEAGRIAWIWYILPIVPSLALGGSYLLGKRQIPRPIRWLIVIAVVGGFFVAYATGPSLLAFS